MERRLYRSKENSVIAGVCGGIAEYFEIDPTIVRIIWVLIGLTGAGVIAYIIAAIIMPDRYTGAGHTCPHSDSSAAEKQEPVCSANPVEENKKTESYNSERSRFIVGGALVLIGILFLFRELFHWIDLKVILSIILISSGIFIIYKERR